MITQDRLDNHIFLAVLMNVSQQHPSMKDFTCTSQQAPPPPTTTTTTTTTTKTKTILEIKLPPTKENEVITSKKKILKRYLLIMFHKDIFPSFCIITISFPKRNIIIWAHNQKRL